MPEREKVIRGLEHCADSHKSLAQCKNCVYYAHMSPPCIAALAEDALALLKDREPAVTTNAYGKEFYRCANCGYDFEMYVGNPRKIKYCPICGQGVKWNA